MSVAPYFKYFRTLLVLCATALVVHWNCIYTFVQKGADLKVCYVHSAAFVISNVCFNVNVSTVRLMKEGSSENIPDFGRGNASYFAVCDNNSQCVTTWCTIEHHFKNIKYL